MKNLKFRKAHHSDIHALVPLINQAYRTKIARSWTSEDEIIVGARIDAEQLNQLLKQDQVWLFIAYIDENSVQNLVGCIALTFQQETVEIGTFCVASAYQNQGMGRKMLEYAEVQARHICKNLKYYEMFVIDTRFELIEYYERCGYSKTNVLEPYPTHANVGQPLIHLQLQQMRKPL